jgi:glycerophosphoryl diester phosphodiesterase
MAKPQEHFRFSMIMLLAMTTALDGGGTSQAADSAAISPAEKLLALDRPLVIAHRGYPQFAPENTLPAFQLALEAGADLVELDYHHTKEGTPIVIHDADLDRTTDATNRWGGSKLKVAAYSAADLQALDAGAWFSPNFAGTKLPTLTEAVTHIQKFPGGVTLIERKAGDAATCVKVVRAGNWMNQLVVQSFDWDYLRDYHRLEPKQILGALGPQKTRGGRTLKAAEKILDASWVDEAMATGARIVVWNNQITPAAVAYAHSKGLKVWVYTINDMEKANELLDAGVDGIITNNTSLIWKTLALRQARAAAKLSVAK